MTCWVSLISSTARVISPRAEVTSATCAWIAPTWASTSAVARAVSLASSLTSWATTAKPRPASPARAASMVAFSASRLVWEAMPEIRATTFEIAADDADSPATWTLADAASAAPCWATTVAELTLRSTSSIEEVSACAALASDSEAVIRSSPCASR